MKEMGKRLKGLRESMGLSQMKMAEILGLKQPSINRYEQGTATPTVENLRKYADYFDVSMDYIFARTDNPEGKMYAHQPKALAGNKEVQQFIELCFDPGSPYNERLKDRMCSDRIVLKTIGFIGRYLFQFIAVFKICCKIRASASCITTGIMIHLM